MNNNNQSSWVKYLITFVGFLFIFTGIFLSIKTAYNILIYKDKYPLNPFFIRNQYPVNLLTGIIQPYYLSYDYFETEEDCQKHLLYYNAPDVSPQRESADNFDKIKIIDEPPDEKKMRKRDYDHCVKKIQTRRKQAKEYDIWTSIMFLLLGGGTVLTRRLYLK